jgi:hypothetical protein
MTSSRRLRVRISWSDSAPVETPYTARLTTRRRLGASLLRSILTNGIIEFSLGFEVIGSWRPQVPGGTRTAAAELGRQRDLGSTMTRAKRIIIMSSMR